MFYYLIRRTAGGLVALLCIITLTFFLLRLMPGGPFDKDRAMDPAVKENIEKKWKLDKPLVVQYGYYLVGLCKLDLGDSMSSPDQTVRERLAAGLGPSLGIGGLSLAFAVIIGVLAGVISAAKQNTFIDYTCMSASIFGFSIPCMVLGPVMAIIFGLWLGWLPTSGWGGPQHLILPSIALGAAFAGRIARIMRASMLEVVREDFVRTARAKGLTEFLVIVRHASRQALNPIISYLGPAAAGILTGSIVIEQIFAIPGIGTLFVKAPQNRDYTLVLGTVLLYSSLLIFFNVIVDVVQAALNPRVRLE